MYTCILNAPVEVIWLVVSCASLGILCRCMVTLVYAQHILPPYLASMTSAPVFPLDIFVWWPQIMIGLHTWVPYFITSLTFAYSENMQATKGTLLLAKMPALLPHSADAPSTHKAHKLNIRASSSVGNGRFKKCLFVCMVLQLRSLFVNIALGYLAQQVFVISPVWQCFVG